MSDKKKILVYSPYSLQVGGGIETWIFYLAEYFNKFVKDAKLIIATNQEHNKENIRIMALLGRFRRIVPLCYI